MGAPLISAISGVSAALTGITLVFVTLLLMILFISAVPRALPLLNSILPEVEGQIAISRPAAIVKADAAVDEEIVAAISMVLHSRRCDSRPPQLSSL